MNTNTLRFGIARTAVLTVVIAAAALYAGRAEASTFEPQRPSPALTAELTAEVQAQLKDELVVALAAQADAHRAAALAASRAARVDLLSKVAASALAAPRGLVLSLPAALLAPTL